MCSKILIISHGRLVAFDAAGRPSRPGSRAGGDKRNGRDGRRGRAGARRGHTGRIRRRGRIRQPRAQPPHGDRRTGDVYELSKEIFLAFAGNNTALCELGVRKASLEDIFLELTEGGEAQ